MRRLRSPGERKRFRDGRNAIETAVRAREKTDETHLRRKHSEPAGQKEKDEQASVWRRSSQEVEEPVEQEKEFRG